MLWYDLGACLMGGVMSNPAAYVQPIHFEDFDGSQFERLVFAYHARTGKWKSLEWYGKQEVTSPRHRGVRDDGTKRRRIRLYPVRQPQESCFC